MAKRNKTHVSIVRHQSGLASVTRVLPDNTTISEGCVKESELYWLLLGLRIGNVKFSVEHESETNGL